MACEMRLSSLPLKCSKLQGHFRKTSLHKAPLISLARQIAQSDRYDDSGPYERTNRTLAQPRDQRGRAKQYNADYEARRYVDGAKTASRLGRELSTFAFAHLPVLMLKGSGTDEEEESVDSKNCDAVFQFG